MSALSSPPVPASQLILGIDPGSRITGFALLRTRRQPALSPRDFLVVDAGVLRADIALPHGQRLGLLHCALFDLVAEFNPTICVLEKAFVDKNASSALKLGELRGAYMAACARHAIPVAELTPAEVKKTLTGNGHADKELVSLALKSLLGFDRGTLPTDATDALALSLVFGMRMAQAALCQPLTPPKSPRRSPGAAAPGLKGWRVKP